MTRSLVLAAIVVIAALAVAAPVAGSDALREGKHLVLGYLQASAIEAPAPGRPAGNASRYPIAAPAVSPAGQAATGDASRTPAKASAGAIAIPEGAEWPLLLFAVVGLLIGRRMSRSMRSHIER